MIKLFGIAGAKPYAENVARVLDMPLSKHIEKYFEDGELYVRSDENVRGCDVYIIASMYSDNNNSASEKLATILFFVSSLRDASAKRITLVVPYLAFSRQDRKTESRAPIATKYVAQLLESVGVNRLLTMDVHNLSALQNAFRIPTDNLESKNLIIDFLVGQNRYGEETNRDMIPNTNLVVLSPDSGGMSRAKWFARSLEKRIQAEMPNETVGLAYFDKERISSSEIKGSQIIGDIRGKNVIIVDDMISSGGTIKRSGEAIEKFGGKLWGACATHGLFTSESMKNLAGIPRLFIADTIPVKLKEWGETPRIWSVNTYNLFAIAIRRPYEEGGSISQLLQD